MFFKTKVGVRMTAEELKQIERYVTQYHDIYETPAMFCRIAVIRELKRLEERLKYVK